MSTFVYWTPTQAAAIIELRVQGIGPKAISARLGLSENQVAYVLRLLRHRDWPSVYCGAKPRPRDPRADRVLELWRAKWTYTAIAGELGCTKSTVAGIIYRYRGPDTDLERRLRWLRDGCRWIEGDPKAPDWHWCGAECSPGTDYCSEHLARMWKAAA